MGCGARRCRAHARRERLARAREVAQAGQRAAALAERRGRVGREGQRLVGGLQRALRVAGEVAGDGQVPPGLRVLRARLHAGLEDGDGAATVAGVDQRGAQQVGDGRGLRAGAVRSLERRHRLGDAAQLAQHAAEVGLHVGGRRQRLRGALELLAGFLQPLAAQQHGAEVVQRAGVLGLGLERLRDQRLRGGEVAALQRDHAQQVRGVEVARRLVQELLVEPGGLVQPAGLVQGDRLVQEGPVGRDGGVAGRANHQISRCELPAATTDASA